MLSPLNYSPGIQTQKIKNVFVIGNGFDLSLGLPTSYSDFLASNFFTANIENSTLFRHISESYIANFNYTNTVQLVLNELSIDTDEIDSSVHHIHGECRQQNIVFGVNDKANIHTDHVFLYKSTSNHPVEEV